jgi:hypothetical protein
VKKFSVFDFRQRLTGKFSFKHLLFLFVVAYVMILMVVNSNGDIRNRYLCIKGDMNMNISRGAYNILFFSLYLKVKILLKIFSREDFVNMWLL